MVWLNKPVVRICGAEHEKISNSPLKFEPFPAWKVKKVSKSLQKSPIRTLPNGMKWSTIALLSRALIFSRTLAKAVTIKMHLGFAGNISCFYFSPYLIFSSSKFTRSYTTLAFGLGLLVFSLVQTLYSIEFSFWSCSLAIPTWRPVWKPHEWRLP